MESDFGKQYKKCASLAQDLNFVWVSVYAAMYVEDDEKKEDYG